MSVTCFVGRILKLLLHWINGKEKSLIPWVKNKVVAMRKVVEREKRYFVKSEINPADIPTRLASNPSDCFSGCWFDGPQTLWSKEMEAHEAGVGSVDFNSLVRRVEVELPNEVLNFSCAAAEGMPNPR